MTIGIDGNEANVEKKVGVSNYTYHMLLYFNEVASEKKQFVVFLRDDPRNDLPKENRYFKYKVIKAKFLWRDVFLPLSLYRKKHIDLFFSPAHYTPRFCPVPIVVTIHDVSYIHFPDEFLEKDLYKLTHWTAHAVTQARKIIAVSESTKKDIIAHYHISKNNINVIYNGYEKYTPSIKKDSSLYSLPQGPYFLYVGTIQPRKNIKRLIEAFGKLLKKHPNYKLVIVGKKGWLYGDIFDKALELGLEDSVIFSGYVSNEQLSRLYKNALCCVVPSLYEGFGLPVLESMGQNCPVIASNISSIPEVGGKACLYFNPYDEEELEKAMIKVATNEKLHKELVEKGKQRVKEFSWEKCAKETLAVLESTI